MEFNIDRILESEVICIYKYYFSKKCPQIITDYYKNINKKIYNTTNSAVIIKCFEIIIKKKFDAVEYRNRQSDSEYIKLLRKKIEIVVQLAECHHDNFKSFINLNENKLYSVFNLIYRSVISIFYAIFYKIHKQE